MKAILRNASLLLFAISLRAAEPVVEPWVEKCSIDTGGMIDADARSIAGGISLERGRKHLWTKQVEAAEGVLVVHPISKTKPAKIRCKFTASEARGKTFVFKARGSDVVPGVLVKLESRNKPIKEVQLGRAWELIEIPTSALPADAQDVTIEIHAVDWRNEYTYIDFIGLR